MGIDSRAATQTQRNRPPQFSNVRSVVGRSLPRIYRVPALEVALAPGAVGAAVRYRWNKALFIVGVQLFGRADVAANHSTANTDGLDLAWQNEAFENIATSGSIPSTLYGGLCREFNWEGFTGNFLQVDMQVRAHDTHTFQVTNNGANTVTPILGLMCVEDDS